LGLSRAGSLIYIPGGVTAADSALVWVDREAKVQTVTPSRRDYRIPNVSPDGRRVAVSIFSGGSFDVWVLDLNRDTLTRLTFRGGSSPVWSPDGKRLAFDSSWERRNLYWKAADGSGPEERLTNSPHDQQAESWSPDGKSLVFREEDPANGPDLWVLPLEGDRKPRPFLQTRFAELFARISPDGRWLAYASDESGRFEVYVQPFPGPGGKSQASTDGGTEPAWAGRELFYRNGDKMMAVEVTPGPSFVAAKPRMLFQGPFVRSVAGFRRYDVAPDGKRFVMIQRPEVESGPPQINVVLNWVEELRERGRR